MKVKKIKCFNWKTIFVLFSLTTLISCSTIHIGQDFEIQAFAVNAQLGKTKKEQVLKWLGKPISTGISQKADNERLEEWVYYYGTGQMPNMKDTKFKMLQIRFDKKGVLRSYNWTGEK